MAKREVKIEKGKDLLTVMTAGQHWLVLRDSDGEVLFSAEDKGQHHTIVVGPGSYLLETDGRFGEVSVGRLDIGFREPTRLSALKPPAAPKGQKARKRG